jgi:hypothetical protein
MPFTEHIRLKGQEFFHGFSPLADVGTKTGMKWTVNILAEEDALTSTIKV